jgi:hypothetical protein
LRTGGSSPLVRRKQRALALSGLARCCELLGAVLHGSGLLRLPYLLPGPGQGVDAILDGGRVQRCALA